MTNEEIQQLATKATAKAIACTESALNNDNALYHQREMLDDAYKLFTVASALRKVRIY